MKQAKFDVSTIESCLIYMGEELLSETIANVRKTHDRSFSRDAALFREHNVDLAYVTDYSNDRYIFGDKFVYGWVDSNGRLFYIGQGDATRVIQFGECSRSNEFMKSTSERVKVFLFAKYLNKDCATEVEKMLIQTACLYGFKLANKRECLSDKQTELFRHYISNPIAYGEDKLWDDYDRWRYNYEEVYKLFQKFILDCLFTEDTVIATELNKFFKYKDNIVPRPKKTWTIDGETKTCQEWCSQYGRSYSNVLQRVEKFGLSIKMALTLPSVQYKGGKDAMTQWKEMGLL